MKQLWSWLAAFLLHLLVFGSTVGVIAGDCSAAETPTLCRSCQLSAGIPQHVWDNFKAALGAAESLESKDQELGEHLRQLTNNRFNSANPLGTQQLRRLLYPWRLETSVADTSPSESVADSEEQQRSVGGGAIDEKPIAFTWENADWEEERTLLISSERTPSHGFAIATAGRKSGRWYWEVLYSPGSQTLPHRGFVGIAPTYSRAEPKEIIGVPEIIFASIARPTVLQFAVNLDVRVMHYGIDGTWMSDPLRVDTGTALPPYGEFAPAVIPEEPEADPYVSDTFEFNFGQKAFQYATPSGYVEFDAPAEPHVSTRRRGTARASPRAAEQAFAKAVYTITPQFESSTIALLKRAVKSWRRSRDLTCRLVARANKVPVRLDAACMREFDGVLLSALPMLRKASRATLPYELDELPSISLMRNPKLHFVEGPRSAESHQRAVVDVHVTDKSAPLILFFQAYGPVRWRVHLEEGVEIQHILAYGQYKQMVEAPSDVTSLRTYSAEEDNGYKIWRELSKAGDRGERIEYALDLLTGLRPSSVTRNCIKCEISE